MKEYSHYGKTYGLQHYRERRRRGLLGKTEVPVIDEQLNLVPSLNREEIPFSYCSHVSHSSLIFTSHGTVKVVVSEPL